MNRSHINIVRAVRPGIAVDFNTPCSARPVIHRVIPPEARNWNSTEKGEK